MKYPNRHGSYNDYSMYNTMSIVDLRKVALAIVKHIVRIRRNPGRFFKGDPERHVKMVLRPRWIAVRMMIKQRSVV